ncbi:MAG TPA: S46 family peptidase [Thermoanaerobaculia bacterium]|nr:S46 family peptidase [Thermoanaerobaculia bacterium]
MKMRSLAAAALPVLLWTLAGGDASAVEGKWTPEQVLQLDPKWLRELGLEIPPERLWGRDGAGLLEAAVQVSGCSAGFVSAEGLLITNHHCAFPILQQHSSPERDLITNGFLARNRGEELAGGNVRATIPHRTKDVTAEIEAAAGTTGDDLARFQAIERKTKEMIAACEAQPNRRCRLEAFDGGVQYVLFESLELSDVRLVYAPPRAVGEFGGEVDNWMWPRHNGDFALLRVYGGPAGEPLPHGPSNVPYRPRHWFPLASREGVKPGDFVMVAGYPALTVRSLTEAEMRERGEHFHPRRAELYRAWIGLMESVSEKDEAGRIALADRVKGLANQEKNSRGQVAGLRRGRILERKRDSEREVLAWAKGRPEHAAAVAAHQELARLMEGRMAAWERDFLLDQITRGAKPLHLALTLARWAGEKAKPDLERDPDYMERNRDRVRERLRLDQRRMYLPAEQELLADLLARFSALPEGSRSAAVDSFLGPDRSPEKIRARAADLLARTRVVDLDERMRMFEETEAQLRGRRDPLLDLAFALDLELRDWKEREDRYKGAVSRLRPSWQRAVIAHAGRPVAPDANGTLRVSFGHVKGYSPRDAVRLDPRTTLSGVIEKHTGEEPFDVPEAVLSAAAAGPRSRWADPVLKDVPVGFLADADTTGGSSGSPVINGRGELVGVNFDRVWENVANDFGYLPEVGRNISVDVRYLLWMLDALHGADAGGLLTELGVGGEG